MDTTKKYIEMCAKAKEIQELWVEKQRNGDWLEWYDDIRKTTYVGIYTFDRILVHPRLHVWLPRQDQLQEMVISDFDDVQDMFYNFGRWIYNEPNKTAEQFWLGFVMDNKYEKRWDGKKWIKGG